MDFAFTDDQDALRQGVRTVLDTECSVDALRAFELADEAGHAPSCPRTAGPCWPSSGHRRSSCPKRPTGSA